MVRILDLEGREPGEFADGLVRHERERGQGVPEGLGLSSCVNNTSCFSRAHSGDSRVGGQKSRVRSPFLHVRSCAKFRDGDVAAGAEGPALSGREGGAAVGGGVL